LMMLMLRDSRQVNAAILERMQALVIPQAAPAPTPSESPKSFDWIPARYKLVLGKKGGPPAVGFKVQVQGMGVLGETEKEGRYLSGVIEEMTGTDGMADLGLFRFGSYLVTVTAPWGEFTRRQIGLRPGQEPIREIVCPAAPPEEDDVTFAVEW